MNRWISATGILLLGLAACIWAVSHWRVQTLRAKTQLQEHELKERAFSEQRERQAAILQARTACDEEAEQRALEQYSKTHPKYSDDVSVNPDGTVSVIPNGVKMHDDDRFLRSDYEAYYEQCVRLAGAE